MKLQRKIKYLNLLLGDSPELNGMGKGINRLNKLLTGGYRRISRQTFANKGGSKIKQARPWIFVDEL